MVRSEGVYPVVVSDGAVTAIALVGRPEASHVPARLIPQREQF